jgi:hypothetical protein
VALTAPNAIAMGTALTITSGGTIYGTPTSAAVTSGTATCSGTASVSTVLTGTGIPIRSHLNPSNNIGTAYAASGSSFIQLMYSAGGAGGFFVDMSQ